MAEPLMALPFSIDLNLIINSGKGVGIIFSAIMFNLYLKRKDGSHGGHDCRLLKVKRFYWAIIVSVS